MGHQILHVLMELWKTYKLLQPCPTLCDPMDCSPPRVSVRGDTPGKNTGVGCHDLPDPGD